MPRVAATPFLRVLPVMNNSYSCHGPAILLISTYEPYCSLVLNLASSRRAFLASPACAAELRGQHEPDLNPARSDANSLL